MNQVWGTLVSKQASKQASIIQPIPLMTDFFVM